MYCLSPLTVVVAAAALTNLAQLGLATPMRGNATDRPKTVAQNMKYRTNNINFWNHDAHDITGIKFVVTDFYITPGQDPLHQNNISDIHDGPAQTRPSAGTLTFNVGRHESAGVAQWFQHRVSSTNNNYNKYPVMLNFAFQGYLTIAWVDGTELGFHNFYLAQGHTGTLNDWWIGGDTCTNKGTNYMITCTGLAKNGDKGTIDLCRGLGCNDDTGGWGWQPDDIGVWNLHDV